MRLKEINKNRNQVFPKTGLSEFRLWRKLKPYLTSLKNRSLANDLGSMETPPKSIAIKTINRVIALNPNHLGNWSGPKDNPWATQIMEREIIAMMSDLYHSSLDYLGGYVTSGGSESNLFLAWTGREWLKNKGVKKMTMLITDLSHYSIKKAAKILAVPTKTIGLDEEDWGMSSTDLSDVMAEMIKEGHTGFLLPITQGYPMTGTSDRLENLVLATNKLVKEFRDIKIFSWIDSALDGLVEPFANNDYCPFFYPMVRGLVVDFHKAGGVPFSAGVVLYRQNLRKLIESPIDYLIEPDATLLGGRPGAAAAAIWSIINRQGRQGLSKTVNNCLTLKNQLTDGLSERNINFVTGKNSLTVGILEFDSAKPVIPQENQFGIKQSKFKARFAGSRYARKITMYKIHLLPHLEAKTIKKFFQALDNTRS